MITRDALASLILDLAAETNHAAEDFATRRKNIRIDAVGVLSQEKGGAVWKSQYEEWERMTNQQKAAVMIAEAINSLNSARVYLQ
jgi:hypothetical protein